MINCKPIDFIGNYWLLDWDLHPNKLFQRQVCYITSSGNGACRKNCTFNLIFRRDLFYLFKLYKQN